MKINFSYKKRRIEFNSGYIFKGRNYRCLYTKFPSLYRNPSPGTEMVELYNFNPKSEVRASVIIMHGLGSANVKFLLWMGTHLASSGIHASVLILPGNYTRVENGSVSGSSFLRPPLENMFRFWEHAVVDTLSTIDFLEQQNLWKENNCLFGYCLGGMLSTIAPILDNRINQIILMATGGHIPRIIYESKVTRYVRKLFSNGIQCDYHLGDKKKLYSVYNEQLPEVKKMSADKIMNSESIHPLFRIDPLSYAHLLDKTRTVFIDALFDRTLPFMSRRLLYKEMAGMTRVLVPIGHGSWLPFEYLLARYILYKVHINDKKAARMLIRKEFIEDPLDDYIISK